MIRVESDHDQVYVAKVYEAGQEQVFRYWDELTAAERRALLDQLASIDFQEFARLVRHGLGGGALGDDPEDESDDEDDRITDLTPVDMIPIHGTALQDQARARAREAGLRALREGEVGVFLVAGGQGTRLGFEGPKGAFPLMPLSGASLFQHFAEKIIALGRRVRRRLPWFIMTSPLNHAATQAFFQENRYFGLQRGDVLFTPQAMLPVIDPRTGKILMASKSELLLSPNGHGGAIRVMQELRETFRKLGVKTLFYHQVDNPLVHMAEPEFIGYHLLRDSQFSSKAVPKQDPDEKVGVFCRDGASTRIVEYTELGDVERHARNDDGTLAFRAGNIACHVISTEFVAPAGGAESFEMPYHIARKAVRHLRDGELVEPTEPNSIRFESFIFDVIPRARNPLVIEADREREFAPVKNAEGENSPEMARRALAREWARWFDEAGVEVPRDEDGNPRHPIEVSPLVADCAANLAGALENRTLDTDGPIELR